MHAAKRRGVRVRVIICLRMWGSIGFALRWLLGMIASPPCELIFVPAWGLVGAAGFAKVFLPHFLKKSSTLELLVW